MAAAITSSWMRARKRTDKLPSSTNTPLAPPYSGAGGLFCTDSIIRTRSTKSEVRRPKPEQIRSPKLENGKGVVDFGFRHSGLFRVSDFEFWISIRCGCGQTRSRPFCHEKDFGF